LEEVREIKSLLFGSRKPASLAESWRRQGFYFNDNGGDLGFGLVQNKGGPCGVMAAVQACVLEQLLFRGVAADWANPTPEEQSEALAQALTSIIWQAASTATTHSTNSTSHGKGSQRQRSSNHHQQQQQRPRATVCIFNAGARGTASNAARDYRPDGLLDKLVLHSALSRQQVYDLVSDNAGQFTSKNGPGTVMLLCSVVLSRGISLESAAASRDGGGHSGGGCVRSDIDTALGGDIALIGNHNYAAQEVSVLYK
jgi:hypothetical protein